ncbi:MAG: OsmC family protein [Acidobacteriota bacterium]|nr:OsmC family protein [Acidobacteriota bacterium]MDH3523772.1 OsmC family protein [Acidobacteriota bacterium]
MSEDTGFSLTMKQVEDFEFEVRFDGEHLPVMTLDEPQPIGHDRGPSASRLLAAAVGNCLSASLLFCLRKSRVEVAGIETRVRGEMRRNDRGRLRIGRLDVEITLDAPAADSKRITRCLDLFEDFCVVTASVRKGIDVAVTVVDGAGAVLHREPPAADEEAG